VQLVNNSGNVLVILKTHGPGGIKKPMCNSC